VTPLLGPAGVAGVSGGVFSGLIFTSSAPLHGDIPFNSSVALTLTW
jgi:hypothetical protein